MVTAREEQPVKISAKALEQNKKLAAEMHPPQQN